MRTLHSSRCTLEPQAVAHAQEMFGVLCDPAIYEYEGVPPPTVELLANGYRRSESRIVRDGTTPFLNWVVRIPSGELTGYVQATILATGAMLEELAAGWAVHTFVAALKARNFRSMGLLTHLGFEPASAAQAALYEHDPSDEVVLLKSAASLASTRLDPCNGAKT